MLIMLKIVAVFFILCYFIPTRVSDYKGEDGTFLDRFFIGLIHMTLLTIVLVHLLVFIRLYCAFSLVVCYILSYLIIMRVKSGSWQQVADSKGVRCIAHIIEICDKKIEFSADTASNILKWLNRITDKAYNKLKRILTEPFSGIFPLVVIAAAACLRFKHSIFHAAYPHIDVYSQLIGVKNLAANNIYSAGVYTYGYHAFLSALSELFNIDPYWTSRFIGPLGGVLIVLSVYYVSLKITKSHAAGLIALTVSGLVNSSSFPQAMFRQTAALPQEFAAIFVLPGIYYLWRYFCSGKTQYLVFFTEAFAITMLVHPYASVFLLAWSCVLVAAAVLLGKASFKSVLRIGAYGAAAGVLSLMPLIIGILSVGRFHGSSIQMVRAGFPLPELLRNLGVILTKELISSSPFINAVLYLLPLMLAVFFTVKDLSVRLSVLAATGATILMYLLYRAPELSSVQDMPELATPGRTGVFFSLILPVYYSLGLFSLENLLCRIRPGAFILLKRRVVGSFSLFICLLVILQYPPERLYSGQEEYDAAALNYIRIKSEFPPRDWTIVAPFEQLAQALGYGYHYEIYNFVRDFSLEQAKDPLFKVPIPTRHIFLYTEKRPLNFGREITPADARKELEPEGDDPFMQYYKNKEQRAILEAKAIDWIENYRKTHGGVDIFYEDDNLRIYHICQE